MFYQSNNNNHLFTDSLTAQCVHLFIGAINLIAAVLIGHTSRPSHNQ